MRDFKYYDDLYVENTYSRFDLSLVRGKGSYVYDENGKEYIDFNSGIAVNTLGVSDDGWNPAMKEQFWPRMCHVTWGFPGVKATGGKPFEMEWFDGPSKETSTLAEFLPPDSLQAIAAKTAFKRLPIQGRVIEGSEGWLISHHFGEWPAVVLKNGGTPPEAPTLEKVPTHYHEYLDSCTTGKPTTSSFDWTIRLTDVILLGNVAQLQPGTTLKWDGLKIVKGV